MILPADISHPAAWAQRGKICRGKDREEKCHMESVIRGHVPKGIPCGGVRMIRSVDDYAIDTIPYARGKRDALRRTIGESDTPVWIERTVSACGNCDRK